MLNAKKKKKKEKKTQEVHGPQLALCFTTAVDMARGNFLQTCIKTSLLQIETIQILV